MPVIRKPHYVLLECVEPGGPFELGKNYYAIKGHREGDAVWFSMWLDGEHVRVEHESRFRPAKASNWPLFSHAQRLRFGGYGQHVTDAIRRAA